MLSQNNNSNDKRTLLQDRIRRAKLTVNALLGATVLSGIAILFGVSLAISGDIPDGVAISQVAIMSTVDLTKQLKDANQRLEQTIKDAMEEDAAEGSIPILKKHE